jgi:biotin transport system ATP-binding protein
MIRMDGVVLEREGRRVLDGVDLVLTAGCCAVLTGANGAGKSSLLWTIPGLLSPTAGRVEVDGVSPQEDRFAVRSMVGLLLQHPPDLFVEETVAADVAFGPENLGLDRAVVDRRVEAALDRVGLSDAHSESVRTLSGGQARWAALAGVLAMHPQVVLLDEPAAGLDTTGRDRLRSIISTELAAGNTLLIATHTPELYAGCSTEQLHLADGALR